MPYRKFFNKFSTIYIPSKNLIITEIHGEAWCHCNCDTLKHVASHKSPCLHQGSGTAWPAITRDTVYSHLDATFPASWNGRDGRFEASHT